MALFALSQVDGTISDDVFMDLISDPSADDEMRAQALHFAAERGNVDTKFVMEIYNNSSDSDLKTQCCWVLSDMGGDEALDTLIGIVRKESDPDVRQQAVFWIGQFETDAAADFLLELINEE
jgi:HEAT repeat protein